MQRLIGLVVAAILAGMVWQSAAPIQASIPPCPWKLNVPPTGPHPRPVGILTIGDIGLRTVLNRGLTMRGMADGTDPGLTWGPAIYPKSEPYGKLPGQGRVLGIAGHRTTRLHPFCWLHQVKPGNFITVQVGRTLYVYRVFLNKERANPNDWSYFRHPERYDPARHNRSSKLASVTRAKYIVLGACTPPQKKLWRINVLGRLVGTRHLK